MKKETQNIPELRFAKFLDVWKLIILGDLLSFKNGINAGKEQYGRGVKFINVLDIINNRYINYDNIIGSVEITDKEFEKNEVIYGDILFQRSSETREEVGQANVYLDKKQSAVFGGFVIRGRRKTEYNPLFMNLLMKTSSARKEITTKSGGSTRYNVGQDTLSQVSLALPSLPEQQKIASFLTAVDKKIEQLTRKKELLEQYKKGVMQKIFSQEIRFKDDNGQDYPDWELSDFQSHMKIKTGNKDTQNKVDDGKYPFFVRSNNLERINSYGYDGEAILTSGDGVGVGKNFHYVNQKFDYHQRVYCLHNFKKSVSGIFVYYYFSTHFYRRVLRLSAKNSVDSVRMAMVAKMDLPLPTIFEQQKIANLLSSIDKKITKTQTQLTQTKTFKKGLLQKMFV